MSERTNRREKPASTLHYATGRPRGCQSAAGFISNGSWLQRMPATSGGACHSPAVFGRGVRDERPPHRREIECELVAALDLSLSTALFCLCGDQALCRRGLWRERTATCICFCSEPMVWCAAVGTASPRR